MTDSAGHANNLPTPDMSYCTTCGQQIDTAWRFCAYCGATNNEGDGTEFKAQSKSPRHRLGTQSQRPILTAANDGGTQEYLSISGLETSHTHAPKRRRKRRPFYRRKIVLLPTLALLCVVTVLAAMVYQANTLMSSLHSISTPPAEITDSTYVEDGDPDMPGGPITVQTGPAQEALTETAEERDLPEASDDGFTARLQGITSGIGDVAGGAAVASGLRDGSDEGFTILMMGVDAQPGSPIDIGVRPDVLMLIRFDPVSQSCRMLSIPRDTRVELPGYGESKINHALMVGGISYQLMVTEDYIDQPIDHYVLVDFEAFQEAVNVVGDVNVTVPEDLQKNGETRYAAGAYEFNGEEALAYSRFRTASDDGDIGRVKRQWSVLAGLAHEAQGRDLVTDVNTLVPSVEEHIRTDLNLTEMATIAREYGNTCLSTDSGSIDIVQGTRVQFNDPILDQVVYYNVVPESTVEERVDTLLSGDAAGPITLGANYLAQLTAIIGDEFLGRSETDPVSRGLN